MNGRIATKDVITRECNTCVNGLNKPEFQSDQKLEATLKVSRALVLISISVAIFV